jgi:predicted esterase
MDSPAVSIIFPQYPTLIPHSCRLEAVDMRLCSNLFFPAMIVIALISVAAGAEETAEQKYPEFRVGLMELYNAEKYSEAAKLIEDNYDSFPGEEWKMSYNMAAVCQHLGDYEKGIRYLAMAQDKGQFFNAWAFNGDFWAPYRETEGFADIQAQNDEMIAEAQKTAKMKIEVALPGELEDGRTYPLFIALHGGGENIEEFRPNWKSPVMESEFIIAYVQSSQVVSMTGFSWEEQEVTKKELKEAYDRVLAEYPVDTAEVLIGGFSSGGYGSLVATFFEAVPVRGFVILCPPMPENITEVEAEKARERGVRGTLITTELDRRVPDQRKMADLFRDTGLQYQFIITPNIGHWYPENLPEMIDRAIAHIRNR